MAIVKPNNARVSVLPKSASKWPFTARSTICPATNSGAGRNRDAAIIAANCQITSSKGNDSHSSRAFHCRSARGAISVASRAIIAALCLYLA